VLPSGHFFSRKQHFNEDQNVVEAELLSYDKPFVDLIRNDLWVLDPMCLRVSLAMDLHA
jgi:mdm38